MVTNIMFDTTEFATEQMSTSQKGETQNIERKKKENHWVSL